MTDMEKEMLEQGAELFKNDKVKFKEMIDDHTAKLISELHGIDINRAKVIQKLIDKYDEDPTPEKLEQLEKDFAWLTEKKET